MPKQKISASEILNASLELVREHGFEKLNARSIADRLNCSVQPIYSCFGSMEGLMQQLFLYAKKYHDHYDDVHADRKNYFSSIGKCHISFASEEKYLFRFLFQSPYVKANSINDFYRIYSHTDVTQNICERYDLSLEQAENLYINMMIYTNGIACMIAADAAKLTFDDIQAKVNFAFESFLQKIKEDNNEIDCS